MGEKAQHWAAHVLLAGVFGMWAAVTVELPSLRLAPMPEVHAADHRDRNGGPSDPSGQQGLGAEFDLTELEDSDDDSAHRPVNLVVLSPDQSVEHAVRQGDVRQHPALEPETPPPRA